MGTSTFFRAGLAGRLVAAVGIAALVGTGLLVVTAPAASADAAPPVASGPAPIQQRTSSTVTADELPTVQIDNGVVWSQVINGDTVYAGGSFSNSRPAGAAAGTNLTARGNLLAYSLSTGKLITAFAPSVNGTVKAVALSPDGKTLYVGGSFNTANGTARFNLAAFDAVSGALLTTFKSSAGGSYVNAIVATSTTVYVGGAISAANGTARTNLAAFNASNGALTAWAPTTDLQVDTMVMAPGSSPKLIIGGRFGMVDGVAQRGLAAISLTDGSNLPWTAPTIIQNGVGSGPNAGKAGIWALSTDGVSVFGTGWVYSDVTVGNFEGSFSADPATGNLNWMEDCHGDEYGAYSDTVNVYVIGHPHDCTTVGAYPNAVPAPGNMRHALAFTAATKGTIAHSPTAGSIYKDWFGQPAPAMIDWYPDFVTGQFTGQGQAAWQVTGSGNYVVMGGEFPYVNGQPQYGLVRFARPGTSPSKEGPRLSGAKWVPSLASFQSGQVRLSIPLNWDRDDMTLKYSVFRNGGATAVYTTNVASEFWNTPPLSFTDTGLTPGASYSYKVVATDPDGNTVTSATSSVTVSSQTLSPYAQQVLTDGAATYWRLGEKTGSTTAFDWSNTNDALIGAAVKQSSSGAVVGDPHLASTFDGTATSTVSSQNLLTAPTTFTTEAWIRTTSTSGGKIIGYGDTETGTSSNYDRHIYLANDGTLHFGIYNNGTNMIDSTKSYNDGQWHQVVSSLGPNGMALWVDGILVGTNPGATVGQAYAGYWRVGGDNLGGWPNQPSSNSLAGDIQDVSIYSSVLTKAQIRHQYAVAGYTMAVPPSPTDAYGAAVYNGDPDSYWRLDDAVGSTTVADSGQNLAPANVAAGFNGASAPTFGQPGALQAGANKAALFGNGALVVGSRAINNPTVYSLTSWFNTTTTTGGKIIGFGDQPAGTSNSYDRHIYMQDNGQLVFGTYTGQLNTITSPVSYNDGKWHQVVADQGPNGMELWVDGVRVGTNPQTQAQAYSGYWRIGGDTTWGSSSPWFAGLIDEAATYSRVLSPSEISQQYTLGSGAQAQAPTASFTSSTSGLGASFDATASKAAAGRTIATYDWNWGDGSGHGSGVTASHTYSTSGTFTVTLTVTDNQGLTGTSTGSVTVTAPHTAPVAVIASAPSGLTVAFDGTGSTTSDGATISSYAWDFGDGATSTLAKPSHTFAAPNTYPVKLTVVDSLGATSSQVTTPVTVTHAAPVAAFTSTVNQLTVAVDASSTKLSDGVSATYDWNWGDGSAHSSSVTANHTFASAGSQSVTLTVTDSLGATNAVTNTVTTTSTSTSIAADTFTRTVTTGWGTADTGGAWSATTGFSVAGGTGNILLSKAGQTSTTYLSTTSVLNSNDTLDVAWDKLANGAGEQMNYIARHSSGGEYRLKVRVSSTGVVTVSIAKLVGTTETLLSNKVVTGLTYVAGQGLRLRFLVTGSGTTTLNAKIWKTTDPEPTAWFLTSTDAEVALQSAGTIGVQAYQASTVTTLPVTMSVDNLLAVKP